MSDLEIQINQGYLDGEGSGCARSGAIEHHVLGGPCESFPPSRENRTYLRGDL